MGCTEEFTKFLIDQGVVSAAGTRHTSDWAGTGNTIGAIALRLGLLNLDQIDQILSVQENERRLFGQIAVSEKILSEEKIERLLAVQRMHHCVEHVEMLVMHEGLDVKLLLKNLSAYYETQ